MIKREDIIADLHTHTIFSLHAYSTVEENMNYAIKRGMKYLAITDHYLHHGDDISKNNEHYRIKFLENNVNGCCSEIKVIRSAEFNFLQDYGYRSTLSFLKWRPIGLHSSFAPQLSEMNFDQLYDSFVEASDWYTAFNHIERELDELSPGRFKGDMPEEAKSFLEKVVLLAKEKNIFLEINEHSMEKDRPYSKIIDYWMNIAAQNGNRFYLGTDSHFCRNVGLFEKSIELANRFGIGKERILNCNEDELSALVSFK